MVLAMLRLAVLIFVVHLTTAVFTPEALRCNSHHLNMDKITEKINALPQDANYFSLEFFPPKTEIVSVQLQMIAALD